MKPFLETKVEDLDFGLVIPARGLYLFAQQALPLLQTSISASPVNPPTLLITGATASLRGSAKFGTFAAGMFAQRALGQSLAREFGPKGVHVALAVIDSGIDGPRMRAMLGEDAKKAVEEDKVMSPDAIAESHWHLHAQHRSSWTQELDLRPWQEKF
ncbi:hypothetical protein BKA56DRAFT_599944 [Ilyonectria sp. MPI-CAGE-AT-0026]|nr:hypothetical protein BKA56DRAFT_599944 [Ilyonectria sp. MPI-CAGE-AT-0026]